MPREPSTPRIAIWRKRKRLGVAQLGDGLITLPADARTRGQLDWIARRSPKDLTDPVLWKIAAIVHGADLADERYDAPEAPGLDVVLRGLWMVCGDAEVLALAGAAVRRAVRVRPPPTGCGRRSGRGRRHGRRVCVGELARARGAGGPAGSATAGGG